MSKSNIINPATKYRKPSSPLVGYQTLQHIKSKERFRTSRNDKIQVFDCRFNNRQCQETEGGLFSVLLSTFENCILLSETVLPSSDNKIPGMNSKYSMPYRRDNGIFL
jgi:hypothetical protein